MGQADFWDLLTGQHEQLGEFHAYEKLCLEMKVDGFQGINDVILL